MDISNKFKIIKIHCLSKFKTSKALENLSFQSVIKKGKILITMMVVIIKDNKDEILSEKTEEISIKKIDMRDESKMK